MGLTELDKEYRSICREGDSAARIKYCELLIRRMRRRLSADFSDTNNMRSLLLEMIDSAEKEIAMLQGEMMKVQ